MAYTSNSSSLSVRPRIVEAQLVVHQKNEVVYEEKIAVLEFEVKDKSNAITRLKNQLDETLREKDDLKAKLEHVEMPRVKSVRPSGVIIEDWVSDDDEDIFQSNDLQATDKPSFKRIEFTNARNESVKPKQTEKSRIITQNPKGNPQQALKNKVIFDSGCSRHMTGNKDFLIDYQDIDGGFVTFGRSARGELKFNLFSVLQMCDKKNSVLFTETGCLVLSPDFKLLDASQGFSDKAHNKTPYELIIGRPPSISFMRPFGCSVIILNTLDPLGKFDGKAEEGFLVGYSVNSKAFRVFNSQTRKVKENLHVNFLENKPNVAGQGPNWLFDIDSLTNSMNYQPVTAGNQSNQNAGPQETNGNTGLKKNVDAGQSKEKNVSTKQYIVFPLWSSISSKYKSSDETYKDDTADDATGEKPVQKPASENQQTLNNVLDKMMDQEKEAKEQSYTIRKEFEAQLHQELLMMSMIFKMIHLMPYLEDTAEVQNTGIFGSAFDDEDLDTYNSPFVDQVMSHEPTKITQALVDESWVEAMQEE
ncbi:retrovirus-related pol polyprotein from transposon TNT 1-94, partial [Tanacetum coccineum]